MSVPFRVDVIDNIPSRAGGPHAQERQADLQIAWAGPEANASRALRAVYDLATTPLPDEALDLLEIATAVYVADIACRRGEREAWPRSISLSVPVRDPAAWAPVLPDLHRLLFELNRDSFQIGLRQANFAASGAEAMGGSHLPDADCVSMLSGGLDSLAGAAMLQQTGRRPIYSLHQSGNPSVRSAQAGVLEAIERHWPGRSASCACSVEPSPGGAEALPYPPPEQREPSRRCRSFLFMALALATAEAIGVEDVFMCENGVMTAGLPLSASRAGSMSTHSTHPMALALMNRIAGELGLRGRLINPFVYQTKAELLRDVLAPVLSVGEIQSTVSCWAAGRAPRPCGGCVPCLLRQIGMAWAELPEEAHMLQVLERPEDYVGTDAYGNLVDLLRHARQTVDASDAQLLGLQPGLLSLQAAGLEFAEVIAMLRRHAQQTLAVVAERYPAAARLTG